MNLNRDQLEAALRTLQERYKELDKRRLNEEKLKNKYYSIITRILATPCYNFVRMRKLAEEIYDEEN